MGKQRRFPPAGRVKPHYMSEEEWRYANLTDEGKRAWDWAYANERNQGRPGIGSRSVGPPITAQEKIAIGQLMRDFAEGRLSPDIIPDHLIGNTKVADALSRGLGAFSPELIFGSLPPSLGVETPSRLVGPGGPSFNTPASTNINNTSPPADTRTRSSGSAPRRISAPELAEILRVRANPFPESERFRNIPVQQPENSSSTQTSSPEALGYKTAKKRPSPTEGYTMADVLNFVTGTKNPTGSQFRQAMRERGYRERDIRKMGNALERVKNTPGRSFDDFILGDEGFDVIENGAPVTSSGRRRGNKKGLDLGDIIGLGNSVSLLAGGLKEEIPAMESAAEDAKQKVMDAFKMAGDAYKKATTKSPEPPSTSSDVQDQQVRESDEVSKNRYNPPGSDDVVTSDDQGNLVRYNQDAIEAYVGQGPKNRSSSYSMEEIMKAMDQDFPEVHALNPFEIDLKRLGINTDPFENTLIGRFLLDEGTVSLTPTGVSGGTVMLDKLTGMLAKGQPVGMSSQLYKKLLSKLGSSRVGQAAGKLGKNVSSKFEKAIGGLEFTDAERRVLEKLGVITKRLPESRRLPLNAGPSTHFGPGPSGFKTKFSQ